MFLKTSFLIAMLLLLLYLVSLHVLHLCIFLDIRSRSLFRPNLEALCSNHILQVLSVRAHWPLGIVWGVRLISLKYSRILNFEFRLIYRFQAVAHFLLIFDQRWWKLDFIDNSLLPLMTIWEQWPIIILKFHTWDVEIHVSGIFDGLLTVFYEVWDLSSFVEFPHSVDFPSDFCCLFGGAQIWGCGSECLSCGGVVWFPKSRG